MSATERDLGVLRRLAAMPFLDRLELAAVSAMSEGSAHDALSNLQEHGLVEWIRHASPLTATTRRYFLSARGILRLLESEELAERELLRRYPVSSRWRRILLARLDAVAVMYRLASAVSDVGGPVRFRWYRALSLDAVMALPGRRTLGVFRRGPMPDWTAFSHRVRRLLGSEEPLPGALLVVAPDEVRLRHTARLLGRTPVPAYLALERDVVTTSADEPVWRTTGSERTLSLRSALSHVRRSGSLPAEPPEARPSLPEALSSPSVGREIPAYLLPAALKPAEKRLIDRLAEWPWITPANLGGMLGVSDSAISKHIAKLRRLCLVSPVDLDGPRLALSDRGLMMLARRDRTSVTTILRRWSVEPVDCEVPTNWRNVSGARIRQLARHIGHTGGVHRFLAALVRQAAVTAGVDVARLEPPHHAARHFRHGQSLRSIHPDAYGVLRVDGMTRPFFFELERRAVRPGTMAARLAPYMRYYSTRRPVDDNGAHPLLLILFDDTLVESRFLVVARRETARAGVELPLWVSHREMLEKRGPLGRAWRKPDELKATHAFNTL